MTMLGRDLAGPGEVLLRGGPAAQEVLSVGRREVRGAHRRKPDTCVRDDFASVVAQPERRPGGPDRPVTDPPAHLLVRAPDSGDDRDLDLGEDFAWPYDGLVGSGVEVPGLDGP